jgi:hypothetical protein
VFGDAENSDYAADIAVKKLQAARLVEWGEWPETVAEWEPPWHRMIVD